MILRRALVLVVRSREIATLIISLNRLMKIGIWKDLRLLRALARLAVLLNLLFSVNATADQYATEWGPPIGEPLPLLEAYDQAGQLRVLENLAGTRGLLLFLNRSADW